MAPGELILASPGCTRIRPNTNLLLWALLITVASVAPLGATEVGPSELSLQKQAFESVPKDRICQLGRQVNSIDLSENQIDSISEHDFHCLQGWALRILSLRSNKISNIADRAFESLKVLQVLQLDNNLLRSVPVALGALKSLRHLNLAHNHIEQIGPDSPLNQLGHSLISLDLRSNPLGSLASDALAGLATLRTLLRLIGLDRKRRPGDVTPLMLHIIQLGASDGPNPADCRRPVPLTQLASTKSTLSRPSGAQFKLETPLVGLAELRFLHLDRANLSQLPAPNLCLHSPRLASLVLKSNQLEQVPALESHCRSLLLLDLSHNRLQGSLGLEHQDQDGAPFQHLDQLLDLYLGHNRLDYIGPQAFRGLGRLQVLELNNNRLLRLHPDAFRFVRLSLRHLNLAHNPELTRLQVGSDLDQVRSFAAQGNQRLRELPHLPRARRLWLTYAYHCCDYLEHPVASSSLLSRLLKWLDSNHIHLGDSSSTSAAPPPPPPPEMEANLSELILWPNHFGRMIDEPSEPSGRQVEQTAAQLLNQPSSSCRPEPGPFLPCQDLFDGWWLRLGVWCVFLLAFAGNILVIVVLGSVRQSSSSSALTSIMWLAHSKRHIDVPRFLVINLAIADLLMALYLGLLALVDLSTLGEFKVFAIKWQHSSGCKLAGFLGVLSSELSVFILAIITLERNYAITNAVHLNRRLSLQKAMLIMLLGYAFALAMAILPLNGQVSDYRKYSICLPLDMDAQNWASQLYVGTLIAINASSLLLLLACYLRMYCAIRGSQAWNTNDLRIARRMSILVLTDFFCWLPIIGLALGSVAGYRLVGHEGVKVLTIFILPLNSIANPFLYAITTKKFKRDLETLARRLARLAGRMGCGARTGPPPHRDAHYHHYQHNLVANQQPRISRKPQPQQLQHQQQQELANNAYCTCRHPAHPPGKLGQASKNGPTTTNIILQAKQAAKSPSNGSLLLKVPQTHQKTLIQRPHSASHIVNDHHCNAIATRDNLLTCPNVLRQPTTTDNYNRSASACGNTTVTKQHEREPARACGSYDMVNRRQKPTASRLGLNWILFGPLAKAWSSIQISLGPTTEGNLNEGEQEEDQQQQQQQCFQQPAVGSPSNAAHRTFGERRMSRSLDILSQQQQQQQLAGSFGSSTQLASTTMTTDDDDQRLMLVTSIERSASRRARCTRCRSWSPALLNKLEQCISQIRSRFAPGAETLEQTGEVGSGSNSYSSCSSNNPAECQRPTELERLEPDGGDSLKVEATTTAAAAAATTTTIKPKPRTRTSNNKPPRHKLQRLGSSSNSDTMSTRTAGTLLTNMSLSFDSSTNIPLNTTGPTRHQPAPLEEQQE